MHSSESSLSQEDKSRLRRRMRRCRRDLSAFNRRLAARAIVRHVLHEGLIWRAQRFGLFVPHGAEIDVLPLINRLFAMGKSVYLPVLPRGLRQKRLWFTRLETDTRWVGNRFGIPEIAAGHGVRARDLDVLCVPLLAYDSHGHRLGMGGGFFDATLAFLRQRRHWRRPFLLGVAYACQRYDERLPCDPWDMALDAVLTEKGVEHFRGFRRFRRASRLTSR